MLHRLALIMALAVAFPLIGQEKLASSDMAQLQRDVEAAGHDATVIQTVFDEYARDSKRLRAAQFALREWLVSNSFTQMMDPGQIDPELANQPLTLRMADEFERLQARYVHESRMAIDGVFASAARALPAVRDVVRDAHLRFWKRRLLPKNQLVIGAAADVAELAQRILGDDGRSDEINELLREYDESLNDLLHLAEKARMEGPRALRKAKLEHQLGRIDAIDLQVLPWRGYLVEAEIRKLNGTTVNRLARLVEPELGARLRQRWLRKAYAHLWYHVQHGAANTNEPTEIEADEGAALEAARIRFAAELDTRYDPPLNERQLRRIIEQFGYDRWIADFVNDREVQALQLAAFRERLNDIKQP